MQHLHLKINKRFNKETIVWVDAYRGTLCTEIVLTTKTGRTGTWLMADAPEWLRELIKSNQDNFVDLHLQPKAGAK